MTAALRPISSEAYWTGMYGYSIGLGFPPTWREMISYIAEGIDLPLEPGMTFHSPISLRFPGTAGVGFSETWVAETTVVPAPSWPWPTSSATATGIPISAATSAM